jgi:hypothetical protein
MITRRLLLAGIGAHRALPPRLRATRGSDNPIHTAHMAHETSGGWRHLNAAVAWERPKSAVHRTTGRQRRLRPARRGHGHTHLGSTMPLPRYRRPPAPPCTAARGRCRRGARRDGARVRRLGARWRLGARALCTRAQPPRPLPVDRRVRRVQLLQPVPGDGRSEVGGVVVAPHSPVVEPPGKSTLDPSSVFGFIST